MGFKRTSFDLVNTTLADDVFSNLGVLLFSKGTTLRDHDIIMLMERGIDKVNIIESISTGISAQMSQIWHQEDHEMGEMYLNNLEITKGLFQKAVEGPMPAKDEFIKQFTPLLEVTLKHTYLFHPLNKIKGHDEYTYRHSLNVGVISSIIGKLIGLPADQIFLLGEMGLFHDIGKMRIPHSILLKPGKLTQAEYEEIKLHTLYGFELLRNMDGTNEMILHGALSHHERLNGSGYPQGLRKDEIPFLVQVLSVADTYDAICSDRVYKSKTSSYFAGLELVRGVYKEELNPSIVIPFVHYLTVGLVGRKVLLDNGESGEITLIYPEEPHRPLIRIGEQYIDLRANRNINISEIVT